MKKSILILCVLAAIGCGSAMAKQHGNGGQSNGGHFPGNSTEQKHNGYGGNAPGQFNGQKHNQDRGHGKEHARRDPWSAPQPRPNFRPEPRRIPMPPPAPHPGHVVPVTAQAPMYVQTRPSVGINVSFRGLNLWFSNGDYYQTVSPGRYAIVRPPVGMAVPYLYQPQVIRERGRDLFLSNGIVYGRNGNGYVVMRYE